MVMDISKLKNFNRKDYSEITDSFMESSNIQMGQAMKDRWSMVLNLVEESILINTELEEKAILRKINFMDQHRLIIVMELFTKVK